MMSSKKDHEIWKDKCINPFQKEKHKGTTTLRRVVDDDDADNNKCDPDFQYL